SRGVTLPRGCAGCFTFQPRMEAGGVDLQIMRALPPLPPEPGSPEPRSIALRGCWSSSTNIASSQEAGALSTLAGRTGEIVHLRAALAPLGPTSADISTSKTLRGQANGPYGFISQSDSDNPCSSGPLRLRGDPLEFGGPVWADPSHCGGTPPVCVLLTSGN